MNDLYVSFMERITPFLQTHWHLCMIVAGAIFLLGAIFHWNWICDPQGDNVLGFWAFIYRNFGEKGYRIFTGLAGIIIIFCGIVLWLLN